MTERTENLIIFNSDLKEMARFKNVELYDSSLKGEFTDEDDETFFFLKMLKLEENLYVISHITKDTEDM